MSHPLSQQITADEMSFDITQSVQQKPPEDYVAKDQLSSNGMYLDFRYMSVNKSLIIPEAVAASSRSLQTQKCGVFPSSSSPSSASWNSPQRSSPPSPMSSSNFLAVLPRVKTPIAELEDTSSAFTYPELEDTSACAIRSRQFINNSRYNLKANNTINRSLIIAVDQRFADYEAEIRFLRHSLASAEKSLLDIKESLQEAEKAADDSSHALYVAQEVIMDRDYELELKKNIIIELEKDVKHCQAHHPPPKPPSKSRGPDVAISRFNVDLMYAPKPSETTKSPKGLSPSTIECTFDASPKQGVGYSSPISTTKKTRLTSVSRSADPSPSIGESPSPHLRPMSQGCRAGKQAHITSEVLVAAFSSAAGSPKHLETASNGQLTTGLHSPNANLHRETIESNDGSAIPPVQLQHPRGRRKRQSSVSAPNLRGIQSSSLGSEAPLLPPRTPMMSGGLGIVELSIDEIQEQKLRRKRGGFGEIFRRKDHIRDQSVSILDTLVQEMEHGLF